jgi:hypothetical protein
LQNLRTDPSGHGQLGASLGVTAALKDSTRTYIGVSDLSTLGVSACAAMSICPESASA